MTSASDINILVIEDDFETQFLFSEILRMENYNVVVASSGVEALDHIKEAGKPDLVIMDLTFPHSTPEEFVQSLNELSPSKELPIIIISGKGDLLEYQERLGAVASFRKPFEIDPVIKQINEIFFH